MLQFWYPKHLPTFRHARWHPVHSSPPRCQKPAPMQPPRLHARDCPLHLHKCTRSHSALPFTPPLNAALASQGDKIQIFRLFCIQKLLFRNSFVFLHKFRKKHVDFLRKPYIMSVSTRKKDYQGGKNESNRITTGC